MEEKGTIRVMCTKCNQLMMRSASNKQSSLWECEKCGISVSVHLGAITKIP